MKTLGNADTYTLQWHLPAWHQTLAGRILGEVKNHLSDEGVRVWGAHITNRCWRDGFLSSMKATHMVAALAYHEDNTDNNMEART
jgi:hypothetical protein